MEHTLSDNAKNFLPFGGKAYLFPDFFSKQESGKYLEAKK
jgi:hypothetical protein